MKKLTLLGVALLLLASCAKVAEPGTTEGSGYESLLVEDPALGQVIDKLYGLMGDLYGASPATRSGGISIASIAPVSLPATKAGDSEPLAYIVNFEGNAGFAMVSTNPYSDDIISISNAGNLSYEEFDRAYQLVEASFEESESGFDDDDDMEDAPDDFLYGDEHLPRQPMVAAPFADEGFYNPACAAAVAGDDVSPAAYVLATYAFITNELIKKEPDDDDMGGTIRKWGPWSTTGGQPTLVRTKWHQWRPYNNACPIKGERRAPAGCVAIATGQIAAFYRRPSYENWSVMSNFGVRNPDTGRINETGDDSIRIVSTYIRKLGDFLHMNYGATSSGATTAKAAKYFKEEVRLNNVARHKYKWERVKDRLDLGNPVYMHGFRTITKGHMWVVDGYIHQIRFDTNPGHTNDSQSRDLLHINWGWDKGLYDGYYVEGTFDPTQRAIEIDAGVGDKGNFRTDISAYTKRLKTLTWATPEE